MITKIDAAERQLNTAIRLFFENVDHLSSYTLAVASREITDDLLGKNRDDSFRKDLEKLGEPIKRRRSYRERFRDLIKPEYYKDAVTLFNRRKNFLKHADRDPDAEMDDLSAKELALSIGFSIWNFNLLTGRQSREMAIFFCWLGAAEPHLFNLSTDPLSHAILEFRKTCSDDPYDSAVFDAAHRSLTNFV